ncbi:MAG: histidine phosphatase family protein [Anaerolineales bacterium]|nr:histidine phosphatase family protein [Anaerolineales bacterium]
MTELILIRHGQTEWNQIKRYQGHTDIPLNDTGIDQALQLAERLHSTPLEAVYTSDLQRAFLTASYLADSRSLVPVIDQRLREINHGQWEGMLHGDIQRLFPDHLARFDKDPINAAAPGGETIGQLQQRMLKAVNDIICGFPNGPVAVVSHGLALATLLAQQQEGSLNHVFDLIPENAVPVYLQINIPL